MHLYVVVWLWLCVFSHVYIVRGFGFAACHLKCPKHHFHMPRLLSEKYCNLDKLILHYNKKFSPLSTSQWGYLYVREEHAIVSKIVIRYLLGWNVCWFSNVGSEVSAKNAFQLRWSVHAVHAVHAQICTLCVQYGVVFSLPLRLSFLLMMAWKEMSERLIAHMCLKCMFV